MKIVSWLGFVLFAATGLYAGPADEIRAVIEAQQQAWNGGDIDAFMNGYARAESTTFVSEDTVRRGWETVRARYKQKFRPHEDGHARFLRTRDRPVEQRFRGRARSLATATRQ